MDSCSGKVEVPCFHQSTVGLKYFCLQHSLLWPCFPESDEILARNQRIVVAAVDVAFSYLMQIVWTGFLTAEAKDVAIDVSTTFPRAAFLSRIIQVAGSSLILTLLGYTYVPIARVSLGKRIWADSPNPNKVKMGKVLSFLIVFLFFTMFVAIIASVVLLLSTYDCQLFLGNVVYPFVATVATKELVTNPIFNLLLFILSNLIGKKPAQETQPLLSS